MLELLFDALHSKAGIVVKTDDVERCRQKLYALRKQHPELSEISLVPSPTNPKEELWLVKKGDTDGEKS